MEQKRSSSRAVIVLADCIALALSVIGVFALRTSDFVRAFSIKAGAEFQTEAFTFYALTALLLLPLFRLNGMYKYKVLAHWLDQLVQIIKSFITIAILQILILFFWKDASFTESARGFILGFGGFGILLMGLERYLISRLVRSKVLLSDEVETKKALIVGAGRAGEKFALRVLNDPELGVDGAWFVDDDPKKAGTSLLGFPVYGGVDNITSHAITTGADEIYIVINTIEHDRLMEIIEKCKRTGLPVKVLSRHFHIMYQNGRTVEDTLPAMLQLTTPLYIRPGMIAKRGIDIIGGTIVALLISLPCAFIALLIKLSSPGPVLYASERIGKGGRPFKMYKFRTMRPNDGTEHMQKAQERLKQGKHMGKVEDDPRITNIGRFLRKYSIDEVPQILNVLRGDMSLVGPRPCFAYEMQYFDDWHKRRFMVLPGLTGLWQVTGRQMSNLGLHDAMILDVFYADNFTIWLDVTILLKTIPVVLFGKGGQ